MPSATDLLTEYKKHTHDIEGLEAALELAKKKKSDVVGALLSQHGKGPYDLGDGEDMIITSSKTGTHFFTPRDKWKKKATARAAARASVAPPSSTPRVIEITAVLTSGGTVTAAQTPPGARLDTTSAEPTPTVDASLVAQKPAAEEDPLAAALAEAMGQP
jgi:hypothetical protein